MSVMMETVLEITKLQPFPPHQVPIPQQQAISKEDAPTHFNCAKIICEICGAEVNKRFLINHLTKVHQVKLKENMTCEVCGILVEKSRYSTHMEKGHSEKRKMNCDTCNKHFKTPYYYELHMKRHVDAREYACDICNKTFNTPGDIANHKWQHHTIKPTSYDCEICGESFPMKKKFLKHVREVHTKKEKKKYKAQDYYEECYICLKLFKNLKAHMRHNHYGDRPHECPECGKSFGTSVAMKVHLKTHSHAPRWPENRPPRYKYVRKTPKKVDEFGCLDITCDMCGETMSKRHMVQHITRVHKIKVDENLICEACGLLVECIYYTKHLQKHKKPEATNVVQVIGDKVLQKCEICHKVFTSPYYYDNHMKRHEDAREFKCEYCPNAYNAKGDLTSHLAKAHPEQLKCDDCSLQFSNITEMNRHMKEIHGIAPPPKNQPSSNGSSQQKKCDSNAPEECPVCGKFFKELRRHMRTVHDEKRFECVRCGKKFSRRWNYLRHTSRMESCDFYLQSLKKQTEKTDEASEDVKPALTSKCKICGEFFNFDEDLQNHLTEVHVEANSDYCNLCKGTFSNMQEHSETIHASAPHKCEVCFKSFLTVGGFKSHLATFHKNFFCDYCGRGFNQKSQVEKHILRAHFYKPKAEIKRKTKTCKICKMKFKNTRTHYKKHHQDLDFECPYCPRRFPKKNSRDIHMRCAHSRCSQCPDMVFSSKEKFKEHLQLHPDDSYVLLERLEMDVKPKIKEELEIKEEEYPEIEMLGDELPPFEETEIDYIEFSPSHDYNSDPGSPEHTTNGKVFIKQEIFFEVVPDDDFLKVDPDEDFIETLYDGDEDSEYEPDMVVVVDFKCKSCKKTFDDEASFKYHQDSLHGSSNEKRKASCLICGIETDCVKTHVDQEHNKKMWDCKLCSKKFSFIKAMDLHARIDHGEHDGQDRPKGRGNGLVKVSCSICKEEMKKYEKKFHLEHVHENGQKLMRTCRFCESHFELYQDFKKHIESHDEGIHVCLTCGEYFEVKEEFDEHLRKAHRFGDEALLDEDSDGNCDYEDKIYKCDKCDKNFTSHRAYQYHMVLHNGRRMDCKFCGKLYTSKKGLEIHERSHTDERPFPCKYCEKRFRARSTAHKHMKSHPEYFKSLKCKECQQSFQNQQEITKHEETEHPNMRPFWCHICKKSFKMEYSMKAHLKFVHKEFL